MLREPIRFRGMSPEAPETDPAFASPGGFPVGFTFPNLRRLVKVPERGMSLCLSREQQGVEVGRLEGAVGFRALEDKAARLLGLAELSGGPTPVQLNSLEDVELSVQMEEVVLLGVFGGGQYEQESAALDATLQLLQCQVGDQLISTVDASRLPGLVRSLQLGGLPAVVLFQDGSKVMQLEAWKHPSST